MIILKTTLSFLILLILTRLLGKKQMSQMTFFHYVTGITIGSLAADIIASHDNTIAEEILGLVWWCLLTAFLAYITLKLPKLRVLLDGQPVILIKNGLFEEKSMKKTRISIDDLLIMLRERGIFSILEVDYAILEPNGELSVLKKKPYSNPTNYQMKISTSTPKYLPSGIIIDSHIIYKNLKELGLSMNWLEDQMKIQGVKNIDKILYAEIQDDGSLYIINK